MENNRVIKINRTLKKRMLAFLVSVVFFVLCQFSMDVYNLYEWFYFNIVTRILKSLQGILGQIIYIAVLVIVLIRFIGSLSLPGLFLKLKSLMAGFLSVVNVFFVLWGFHYAQSTLEPASNLSAPELENLYSSAVKKCRVLRSDLTNTHLLNKELTITDKVVLNNILTLQAKELRASDSHIVYPTALFKDGGLRKMGIGGIFFPFTGEPLFDDSAVWLRSYFVYAHEFFHARGVTGEDECNYLAYKTLSSSQNKSFQYAAHLDVVLTSAYLLGKTDQDLTESLTAETMADIKFIREDAALYKSWFHSVSAGTNDLYLKILSSEEGTQAYNSYVKWITF